MQKKIKIFPSLKLNFYCLSNTKFIVLTKNHQNFYFTIPAGFNFSKQNDFLVITLQKDVESDINLLENLFTVFSNWLKSFEKPIVKKLLLKGLGLKATLLSPEQLELKLGFSHIVSIKIPSQLIVSIKKNTINIECYDSVLLGNFLHKIRILKAPNVYKGKGIWYKNELKTLKVVKKT
jgi:large subunit ribosomal protein L6